MNLGFSSHQAEALLKNPEFIIRVKRKSDKEFAKVFKKIQSAYGVTKAQAVKTVISFPKFVAYNHSRVVANIQKTYEATKTQAVKAVLSYPQFASLNHSRVVRQAMRMGRIIGLNRQEIAMAILNKPVLAGYSEKRNLAAIDAFRNAVRRTGSTKTNRELFELYQKEFVKSPYPVKDSKKRETWWQRRERSTKSKMGQKIEKRLRKTKRPR